MTRLIPTLLFFFTASLAASVGAHAQNRFACDSRGWFRPDDTTNDIWIDRPASEAKNPDSANLAARAIIRSQGWTDAFAKQCRALAPHLDFRPYEFFVSGDWSMSSSRGSWNEWIGLAEQVCSGRPVISLQKERISSNSVRYMDEQEKFAVMQYQGYDYFACCQGRNTLIKAAFTDGKTHISRLSNLHAECTQAIQSDRKAQAAEKAAFNKKKKELLNSKQELAVVEIRASDEPEAPAETKPEPKPVGVPGDGSADQKKPGAEQKPELNNNRVAPVFGGGAGGNSNGAANGGGVGCESNSNKACQKTDPSTSPTPPEWKKPIYSGDADVASASDMNVGVGSCNPADGEACTGAGGGFSFNTRNSTQCTTADNRSFDKVDRRFLTCGFCQSTFADVAGSAIDAKDTNVGESFAVWMNLAQACVYRFLFPDGLQADSRAGMCEQTRPQGASAAERVSNIQRMTAEITLRCTDHLGVGPR